MEQAGAVFVAFIPIIIFGILYAIAAYWLSPKIGARRWLWTVLMLIPVVNMISMMVFFVLILGNVLDKINAMSAKLEKSG